MTIKQLRNAGVPIDNVTTYRELYEICDRFIEGHNGNFYPFLIILGSPGLGKSHRFEHQTGYVSGNMSAGGMYQLMFEKRNEVIIFDDIDALFQDKTIVSMMKALMNDRTVKTVSWAKQNTVFAALGIPNQFHTSSRCCIILNVLPKNFGANERAVLTRGKVVFFQPSAFEVHATAATWFADKEIYDFLGEHLEMITAPSFRWYTSAKREKDMGVVWKAWLLRNWKDNDENPHLPVIADLLKRYDKTSDQLAEWAKQGRSRALFFIEKKKYLECQKPPAFQASA